MSFWAERRNAARSLPRRADYRPDPAAIQQQRITSGEIDTLADALGSIHPVLNPADPNDKAEVRRRLNLELTYQPEDRLVRAETTIHPGS